LENETIAQNVKMFPLRERERERERRGEREKGRGREGGSKWL